LGKNEKWKYDSGGFEDVGKGEQCAWILVRDTVYSERLEKA